MESELEGRIGAAMKAAGAVRGQVFEHRTEQKHNNAGV